MSFFLIIVLLILGWFLYRVFISGAGGGRSFVQFYKDHNEIRHDIQKKGGIHNVEYQNIKRLKEKGYKVSEYGENFVEMTRKDNNGQSNVSIIHGKGGKSLKLELYTQNGKEIISIQNKMRSSNGAIETLSRSISKYLESSVSIDKLDKEKIRSHFEDISISDRGTGAT